MSELVERLKEAHANSQQRCLGSNIFAEAADRILELEIALDEFDRYSQDDPDYRGSPFRDKIRRLLNLD